MSGKELIKILSKHFGFIVERQKGSHIRLRKDHIFVTVPLHPTLKKGTLHAILKEAGIDRDEFLKFS